jgi:hypothetical protein
MPESSFFFDVNVIRYYFIFINILIIKYIILIKAWVWNYLLWKTIGAIGIISIIWIRIPNILNLLFSSKARESQKIFKVCIIFWYFILKQFCLSVNKLIKRRLRRLSSHCIVIHRGFSLKNWISCHNQLINLVSI